MIIELILIPIFALLTVIINLLDLSFIDTFISPYVSYLSAPFELVVNFNTLLPLYEWSLLLVFYALFKHAGILWGAIMWTIRKIPGIS